MTNPGLSPREIRYDGVHCNLRIEQWTPGLVVLRISGSDIGEFGDAPMVELDRRFAGAEPVEFYVDARDVQGASIEVSGAWAHWLRANKLRLRHISMLTGSRYIQITADFVRRFADLQGVMRIYTDPAAFDAALVESLKQS